jgi:hypothetical protein
MSSLRKDSGKLKQTPEEFESPDMKAKDKFNKV